MIKKEKIVIFGAGGHGQVILDNLLESGMAILGFIDEDLKKKGKKIRGFEVLGDWSFLQHEKSVEIALGVGDNKIREKIFGRIKNMGIAIVSAVHPKAIISKDVVMGEGIAVMAGAVVNPGVTLEDGVIINTSSSVDHDCYLEKFCQIWPGARLAGTVRVGQLSYVGMGASVIQNTNIGKNTVIGAGSVVIVNIPDNVISVGMPAKIIKSKL